MRLPSLAVAGLLLWSPLALAAGAAASYENGLENAVPILRKDGRTSSTSSGSAARAPRPGAAPPAHDPKYFHEPGLTEELGHYDNRYFKGLVPYAEHKSALRHLIRSYLTVLASHGVETWLAHGTLLGWWWNGHIMPWDYDLDVQVSAPTLHWLGRNLNRTTHAYEYRDDDDGAGGQVRNKTYLLDVNPHHAELSHGDGQNVIDARWIDTDNGMFVDITALTERQPQQQPGVWSCKNFHRYRTIDLYPMRRTEFEGVPATVPYSFERILTEEYGMKSLVVTEWEGYVFLFLPPSLIC